MGQANVAAPVSPTASRFDGAALNLCFAGKTAAVATLAAVLHGSATGSTSRSSKPSSPRSTAAPSSLLFLHLLRREDGAHGLGHGAGRTAPLHAGGRRLGAGAAAAGCGLARDRADRGGGREPGEELLDRLALVVPHAHEVRGGVRLQAGGLPAAPVNSVADLASDDTSRRAGSSSWSAAASASGPSRASPTRLLPSGGPRGSSGTRYGGDRGRDVGGAGSRRRARARRAAAGGHPRARPRRPSSRATVRTMMLGDLGAKVIRVESTKHFVSDDPRPFSRPPKELVRGSPDLGGLPGPRPGRAALERPWFRPDRAQQARCDDQPGEHRDRPHHILRLVATKRTCW